MLQILFLMLMGILTTMPEKRGPKSKKRVFKDDIVRERLAKLVEDNRSSMQNLSKTVLGETQTWMLKFLDYGIPKALSYERANKLAAHFGVPVSYLCPTAPTDIQAIDPEIYAIGAPILDRPEYVNMSKSRMAIRFLQAIIFCAKNDIRDKAGVEAKVVEYLALPALA